MSRVTIVLENQIERRLRIKLAETGGRKGDLSKSVNEAITFWLDKND